MLPKTDTYIPNPVDTTDIIISNTTKGNQVSAVANTKANKKEKFKYRRECFVPGKDESYYKGLSWMAR